MFNKKLGYLSFTLILTTQLLSSHDISAAGYTYPPLELEPEYSFMSSYAPDDETEIMFSDLNDSAQGALDQSFPWSGQFRVVAWKLTPWSKLFPTTFNNFSINQTMTITNLATAQLMLWYYSQVVTFEYLKYCSYIYQDPQVDLSIAMGQFESALKKVKDQYEDMLKTKGLSAKAVNDYIKAFDTSLRANAEFKPIEAYYDFVMANRNFIMDCQYGLMPINYTFKDKQDHYTCISYAAAAFDLNGISVQSPLYIGSKPGGSQYTPCSDINLTYTRNTFAKSQFLNGFNQAELSPLRIKPIVVKNKEGKMGFILLTGYNTQIKQGSVPAEFRPIKANAQIPSELSDNGNTSFVSPNFWMMVAENIYSLNINKNSVLFQSSNNIDKNLLEVNDKTFFTATYTNIDGYKVCHFWLNGKPVLLNPTEHHTIVNIAPYMQWKYSNGIEVEQVPARISIPYISVETIDNPLDPDAFKRSTRFYPISQDDVSLLPQNKELKGGKAMVTPVPFGQLIEAINKLAK